MKQIVYCLYLFFCTFGSPNVACHGSPVYTVQVVASKTPTSINRFAAIHHIEGQIIEIHEKGWYKYVIGEFNSIKEASAYITENLASKDLQGPFPRLLPDSLQRDSLLPAPSSAPPAGVKEIKKTDSVITSFHSVPLQKVTNSDSETDKRFEKYGPWANLVGKKNLHTFEVILVKDVKPLLPRSFVPYFDRMIENAIRYPIIMFFMMLTLLFILNALVVIIILELSNTIKNRLERYDSLYTDMYERALTGYIFQEYDLESAVHRIKGIKYSRNRKILIAVLFNFKKNLSGDLEQKLQDIFVRLGFQKYSGKKTQSYSFYRQILGIRELTNLYPSGAFPVVEFHINDENDELRAEAQTSYVRLNQEEPFHFLKNLRKPFTRWTQLTSFYIFKLHKLPAPSFVEYIKSDLYNVRNFSLLMIIYFQQKENAQQIIELLHAKRERTRFLAIRAVNELGIHEAKPLLKKIFENETYKNRLEIIKGFIHIGEKSDLDFLESIIIKNDVSLKIEACRSMYFMNSTGREHLMDLKRKPELNLEPYIAHIHDPRN